jgi:DNA-binding XRE family transcriptional regulator
MPAKSFSSYRDKLLEEDNELLKAYNELEPQYQLIKELIECRIRENISQSELSRRTGIAKSNISRFENGKHSPSLEMVYRIANGLGKSIDFTISNN